MTKNNPLLGKLNKDLNEYNQHVGVILDKVANWQYYITIRIVIINILAFFVLQSIPESFSIGKCNNYTIGFLASLILLLVSIPFSNTMGKMLLNKMTTNMYTIDPTLDYSGEWKCLTTFRLKSEDDGITSYNLVKCNMDNFLKEGVSTWVLNMFELYIDFAATQEKLEDVECEDNNKPKVEWISGPIEFNANKVSWTLCRTIKWKGGEDIVNEFKGFESYKVVERDVLRRPTKLVGDFLATIKIDNRYYVVTEEGNYRKI